MTSFIHIADYLQAYHCRMNLHVGFHMVPPVSKEIDDRDKWQSFLTEVRQSFYYDGQVEIYLDYIEFAREKSLRLPFEGHKFFRFSSMINDTNDSDIRRYIDTITEIATTKFGPRVQAWNHKIYMSCHSSNTTNSLKIQQEVCTNVP